MTPLDDAQLLRYSRHIMLPRFDITGQQRVSGSHVVLVGAGGLGSPVALYLAAAGVGQITLVDDDKVELTNLQRQILYTSEDIGRPKAEAARDHLLRLNPGIRVHARTERLTAESAQEVVAAADLIIDATDNFAARFALNVACVSARKPWISAAAIRLEAQVTAFLNNGEGPCYRCLYRDETEIAESCSQTGVLGPLVGIIGSIQALEALKMLAGMGAAMHGRVLLLDATSMEWRTLRLRRDPACPVCAGS